MNKRFCKEPEKIENYEKAKKDNFVGWECHHRLETHTPDGERRDVDILAKELKALGMYYNRPANELIFLTTKEHHAYGKGKKASEETKNKMREAKKGKKLSEETKKKMREARKGKQPMLGKHHSEETRRKMREAQKGKHLSEEHKNKVAEANIGMHFFNNGKINIRAKECPDGFVPGQLR